MSFIARNEYNKKVASISVRFFFPRAIETILNVEKRNPKTKKNASSYVHPLWGTKNALIKKKDKIKNAFIRLVREDADYLT